MKCITTEIELIGGRLSQFNGYTFNSMARFGDRYIGASGAGLAVLGGDSDDGGAIESVFHVATTDFGIQSNKSVFAVYLGVESDGDLELVVAVDETDPVEIEVSIADGGFQRKRVRVPGNLVGRYWTIGVSNPGGGYFAVESIEALVKVMHSSHV